MIPLILLRLYNLKTDELLELFCSVEEKSFFSHYTLNCPFKGVKNPFL